MGPHELWAPGHVVLSRGQLTARKLVSLRARQGFVDILMVMSSRLLDRWVWSLGDRFGQKIPVGESPASRWYWKPWERVGSPREGRGLETFVQCQGCGDDSPQALAGQGADGPELLALFRNDVC